MMPTWGEILSELKETAKTEKQHCFDVVRRKYLVKLYEKTKRNVILYATKWAQGGVSPSAVSITDEDIQGLMEVIHGLKGPNLDLILHSPGGSAEATEAFVSYLRSKFDNIRVIVPYAAMSAATMLACAGNKIVMGKHSFLGPIDPQMILHTPLGVKSIPAESIKEQFELAKEECHDPKKLGTWLPILGQYGPALLVECDHAISLSKELVTEWLESYMFGGRNDAATLSKKVAKNLTAHKDFKSHGRHINREKAKSFGLVIEDLEDDQELQDLVLSTFHATTHTFNGTPAVKIIENHEGKSFVKHERMVVIPPSGTSPKPMKPSK